MSAASHTGNQFLDKDFASVQKVLDALLSLWWGAMESAGAAAQCIAADRSLPGRERTLRGL
jgi:hypothetical protein